MKPIHRKIFNYIKVYYEEPPNITKLRYMRYYNCFADVVSVIHHNIDDQLLFLNFRLLNVIIYYIKTK